MLTRHLRTLLKAGDQEGHYTYQIDTSVSTMTGCSEITLSELAWRVIRHGEL